ncbi:MAG: Metallothiol transferase FosB [Phycisphaerae bacterium]|nr:Metallothiol transferase FosB [Phycisphaerae bacterium]
MARTVVPACQRGFPAVTIFLTCSATTLFAQGAAATTEPTRPAVEAVSEVGITVSDLDRAVAFFSDVLTFERVAETKLSGDDFGQLHGLPSSKARGARLRLGDEYIELTEFESPKGRAFPPDSRSNDRWFQHIAIIVSDMEEAHAWLHEKMVRHASKDPQRLPDWNKNAAGIKAFYFRDPDGHFLEVLEFPPDKGNPKWHRKGSVGVSPAPLFLGIDHTAIVVDDTDASLRFYRDMLGFKVVGGSENFGMEQEDLNNVSGAHLRITTLRASAGPAIELLEYLNPRDGRPYPADAQTNDLLHWQTTLVSNNVSALANELRASRARFVSTGVVRSSESRPAIRKALIVRDPDGHALKVVAAAEASLLDLDKP